MNKHKGFTIVELLIVIVIIGILAAISIVTYNGVTQKARESAVKQEAAQTERQIMSFASLNGESADKVSGAMVGYQEGLGESKLLKPLVGTPDITMYMVCTIKATNSSYSNLSYLKPDNASSRFALRTGDTGSSRMGSRIDTPPQSNRTSFDPKSIRAVGRTIIGWLQVNNNATVRLSAYNQAASTNNPTDLSPGSGWNFTEVRAAPSSQCDPKATLVFNTAHDETTRAQVIGWLAQKYDVSL